MDKEKISKALQAAASLMVIEVWAPPITEYEKEARFKAREHVQKLCIEAQYELKD